MGERYDAAVIGTGPAGVSAAVTLTVRNKKVLLIGSREGSEKARKAEKILNYPGLYGVTGSELSEKLLGHLDAMGIEITDKRVSNVYAMGDYFSLQIGQEFLEASTVILASGVSFGKPYPGENENLGRGVSYCATCDAPLYRGKETIVVSSAPKEEEEAAFLSEMAGHVTYIPLYKDAPKDLPDSVEVVYRKISGIERRDNRIVLLTDAGEMVCDGLFLLRESVAPDKLAPGLKLDGSHVEVNRKMETNLPGLYAAGDLTGTPYQYAKAVGEGNVAALSAVSYLDALKRK